ncbi:MAG TPA: NADH-ubiquinone oxidoreductase-F iron-sulfur binding region domain-containing protein [Candidatus Limnocylindrales bacterium]
MADFLAAPADWPRIILARPPSTIGSAEAGAAFDEAVRAGAFEGLKRAVRDLGPTGTIATIAASGLRGRGGAGYPTGDKWRAAANQESTLRYVVANGYGADPATRTDAALIERDPFSLVEGLAIAAVAVGASEAIVALRTEETEAIRRVEAAIGEAEDAGYLGHDILGSGHDVDMIVRTVQGAYMLGEETVLLKALAGKRGQPEQRPPYPTERGLFDRPTVVNNVATLASVPWIIVHGPERFAATGSPTTPGTALVHLQTPAGGGIGEVPYGTPLGNILALVGGKGAGRPLKAVLVGGPSGGFLPPDLLDTPFDFEALRAAGAHVGSGSIVALDDRACLVDLGRILTRFCADEACGKTIPCRIGIQRLAEIGERVASGRPKPTDLGLLGDLSHDVVESALCDHERLATLPLASVARHFATELEDHLARSTCAAGVCRPIAVTAAAGA